MIKHMKILSNDDSLEKLLDAIHGTNRGPQLPGHGGNGKPATPKRPS